MTDAISESTSSKMRPLRFVEPDCYRFLLEQLAACRLHPFDIQAYAMAEEESMMIQVRYGDRLVERSGMFRHEAVKTLDSEIAEFFRGIVEDCKKTLIADYYKMMKV